MHVDRLVSGVHAVVLEMDWVVDFDWSGIDFDVDVQRLQVTHELLKEVSYGTRDQLHAPGVATTCVDGEMMIDEVEVHLKGATGDGNGRAGQAARADSKRDVPP